MLGSNIRRGSLLGEIRLDRSPVARRHGRPAAVGGGRIEGLGGGAAEGLARSGIRLRIARLRRDRHRTVGVERGARGEPLLVAAGEKLAAALALAQAGLDQPPADEREAAQLASSLASAVAALAEQAPGLVPADLHDPAAQQAFAQALAQAQAKGLISEAQRAALEKAGLKPGKPGSSPSPGQARALARRLADELQKRKRGLGTCSGGTAADAFLAVAPRL